MQKRHYLIETFTQHRLASNLLMIILLLAGIWGLRQINVQLNPNQTSHWANVQVIWPGASAEDVERLVTQPIEYQLRNVKNYKRMRSWTGNGYTSINVQFDKGTDMGTAVDEVKQQLSQVRELPDSIEPPKVRKRQWNELVAGILITGEGALDELTPIAVQIERDLLAMGIDTVERRGVPKEEITIEIDSQTLYQMGIPLDQVARKIMNTSVDVPSGTVGRGGVERQLRSLDQKRDVDGFMQLPVTQQDDSLVNLGDIATVERRAVEGQSYIMQEGKPALMLMLRRSENTDTLKAADILYQWQSRYQQDYAAQGVKTEIFLEGWKFAQDQISLVMKNGLSGLLLVLGALFIFLNGRVAFWVAVGIPVSFLGAVSIFYMLGGSINFISMIGMVMALGIVVDDAIVVGEHSLYQKQIGHSPADAAALGAQRMFPPVMASSLTTMAAFLPLIILDEEFIVEIPLLMLCVIIASLVECFLIMPGHLRHSFSKMDDKKPSKFRAWFDGKFDQFKYGVFSDAVSKALRNRRATIFAAFFTFVSAFLLIMTDRVKTELNINLNFEFADANVRFAEGTPQDVRINYLTELEAAAVRADQELGGGIVTTRWVRTNRADIENESKNGFQYGQVSAELVTPDQRVVTLDEFAAEWKKQMSAHPAVEILQIQAGDQEWPAISMYFSGEDTDTMKAAAVELAEKLATYPGVYGAHDDLPYGKEQWIFELTPEGRSLGLTSSGVGRQIRAAFEGYRVQIFTENQSELEVRVKLPAHERNNLSTLYQMPIITPQGESVPLATVAEIGSRRGIDQINHNNGRKAVTVYAHVDRKINTPGSVISDIEKKVLPELLSKYNLEYGRGAGSGDEAEVLADMGVGALIGLLLIYLILAWIFASWLWPLAVMAAIPMGLTGALWGLNFLDLNLGALAIMGLFTLSGVIVNDSIILVSAFKEYREQGFSVNEALQQAATTRLRPVILTSLTTTLGLAPMMFETSPMGEVMAPLAVVICFGMLYGTLLILFVIPAIISALETIAAWIGKFKSPKSATVAQEALGAAQ